MRLSQSGHLDARVIPDESLTKPYMQYYELLNLGRKGERTQLPSSLKFPEE